jgi:hypothetical protein
MVACIFYFQLYKCWKAKTFNLYLEHTDEGYSRNAKFDNNIYTTENKKYKQP